MTTGVRVELAHRAEEPPPSIRYRRGLHLRASARELWAARTVVFSLAERDLRSRYSQMVLGFAWSIIGPLALMAVITFVLGKTNIEPPFGVPRPIWTYLALLPWTFFQSSVSNGGLSLVSNSQLLNKVYAPREVFPIAQIIQRVVDVTTSTTALVALMIIYGYGPRATIVWAPLLLLIGLIFTTAVTIVVSALTVFFRDLRQAIPVVLQLGLFFNPIAFDMQMVSAELRPLFVALNPLAAVIDGLRRTVLYGEPPRLLLTLVAAVVASVQLLLAYIVFKQMETGFADVA